MRIDVHAHYGRWPFLGKDAAIDDFRRARLKHGIHAFILSSSLSILYDMVEGNRGLFAAIQDEEGLYGYVVVNPNRAHESLEELSKYRDHPRFAGVKYHPDYCRRAVDCEEMAGILKATQELGVPILVHTYGDGISSPLRLLPVHERFPGLKIIAAHMGGPRFDLGIELGRRTGEEVVLEICSTDISAGKLRNAVDACGADRVLFGTDYSLFDPSYSIGVMESSDLDDEEKEKIYHANARRVFGHIGFGQSE